MLINLTGDMLRTALIRADTLEMEAISSDKIEEHKFSKVFERKMSKLIGESKGTRPTKTGSPVRRRVIAVVTAILLLLAATMSVSALRNAIFEFISDVYEKYTHIYFEGEIEKGPTIEKFVVYRPTYEVEGFELVTEITKNLVLLEFACGQDFISYSQDWIKGVSLLINTEGVELEEFEFRGLPAKYYSNLGVQNLLWYDDKYLYMVSSTLDRNTVFRIAESVEKDMIP